MQNPDYYSEDGARTGVPQARKQKGCPQELLSPQNAGAARTTQRIEFGSDANRPPFLSADALNVDVSWGCCMVGTEPGQV